MSRVVEHLKKMKRSDRENLRLAALLHDVGHYPYSHLMEGLDKVVLTENFISDKKEEVDTRTTPYPQHDALGAVIVENQPDLVKAIGGRARARRVAALFTRQAATDPQMSKLIKSSLDLDRLDYLLRDSRAAGVPYGYIDMNYLLDCLQISPAGVVGVKEKATAAVEHFLLARFFMHRNVYWHKTTSGFEEACRQLLRRLRDRGEADVPKDGAAVEKVVKSNQLRGFTDTLVDGAVRKACADSDPVVKALAEAIANRRAPKLLKEVPVCESRPDSHAGKMFRQRCKSELKGLAAEFGLSLGQFLFYEKKPLYIALRRQTLRPAEAQAISSERLDSMVLEEEEEDIRVFVAGSEEPVSLMDVDHSIIAKLRDYFFASYRLYVVCEDGDRVAALKQGTKDWNRSD
jgi:hypothetical protein